MVTVVRRQLWAIPTTTTSKVSAECTPFALPSLGVIEINPTSTLTLPEDAIFTPNCQENPDSAIDYGPMSIADLPDPFHASITPQVYATAAATCVAWMLVIMLIITPRTFFVNGGAGTSGLLGRRGMISGARGGASIIGVGSRPWLQKVAALTVAISLTIATADTFKVAQAQYEKGYMDAYQLREEVVGSMEIRVSRIVSDIFLWLAQVQTLIRLFSRHKEKVIIKWTGFALIILDVTFSILNSWKGNSFGRPRRFVDAIPALTYLFQLSLSMLFAAWVLYYAVTKKAFAFYHPMMWNMSVVALLSIIAILTPVVFFITDISNESIAGWGDYFRWVGAAAASVIVWEWVERIEALEREEKKDGILGREVFDGDEMLDVTPSKEVNWPKHRHHRDDYTGYTPGRPGGPGGGYSSGHHGHGMGTTAHRFARARSRPRQRGAGVTMVPLGKLRSPGVNDGNQQNGLRPEPIGDTSGPTPPAVTITPVSRTDSTATSTVYTVQYHPVSEFGSIPMRTTLAQPHDQNTHQPTINNAQSDDSISKAAEEADAVGDEMEPEGQTVANKGQPRWQTLFNPFKKRRASPPVELLGGQVIEPPPPAAEPRKQPLEKYSKWDWKSRIGNFAADQSERMHDRSNGRANDTLLPVTIIPAQPRGRTWSPEVLEKTSQAQSQLQQSPHTQGHSTTLVAASATDHSILEDPQSDAQAAREVPDSPTRTVALHSSSMQAPSEQPSVEARPDGQPDMPGTAITTPSRPDSPPSAVSQLPAQFTPLHIEPVRPLSFPLVAPQSPPPPSTPARAQSADAEPAASQAQPSHALPPTVTANDDSTER